MNFTRGTLIVLRPEIMWDGNGQKMSVLANKGSILWGFKPYTVDSGAKKAPAGTLSDEVSCGY